MSFMNGLKKYCLMRKITRILHLDINKVKEIFNLHKSKKRLPSIFMGNTDVTKI